MFVQATPAIRYNYIRASFANDQKGDPEFVNGVRECGRECGISLIVILFADGD